MLLSRILREAERLQKIDIIRRDRESKQRELFEVKRQRQEEVTRQKQEEHIKRMQEREMKKQQAAHLKEQVRIAPIECKYRVSNKSDYTF
jgi:hypothetical protein